MIQGKSRYDFVDALRGLVIVLMALDHVRDFWGPTPFDPVDPAITEPEWFFTRWITHFCAPIFVFLAGAGAYFYRLRFAEPRPLAKFLVTRGLWLILLEVTVVNMSWSFAISNFFFLQVIWAIGCSMIALAGLIFLPRIGIALCAALLILGHNALDGIAPGTAGSLQWIWNVLHVPGFISLGDAPPAPGTFGAGIYVAYPLIPWVGVMAAGYLAGGWLTQPAGKREKGLIAAGLILIALFVLLRWSNIYGDAALWSEQERGGVYTLLSFLNVTKYPPSLLFLCMTLGPALLLLAWFARLEPSSLRWLVVFGRVPMFFYLIHVPVIHLFADIYSYFRYGTTNWYLTGPRAFPTGYEANLLFVYAVWLMLIFLLYFACRWFADLKSRRSDWWLKYL